MIKVHRSPKVTNSTTSYNTLIYINKNYKYKSKEKIALIENPHS